MRTPALCLPAVLAVWLCPGPPAAAAPAARNELLRLVPDDVTFCLLLQDLREHARALRASPFAADLARTPLGAGLAATPELRRLDEADAFLRAGLGLSAAELRDEILGDAVVVAFRTGGGQGEREQGLILAWVRDPRLAARLVARLHQSPDVKGVREEDHLGTSYFRRMKDRGPDEFLALDGRVLLFSTSERMLREALERRPDRGEEAGAPPPLARALEQLGVQDKMLVWWLNPRSFDAELGERAAAAAGAERAFLEQFLIYWKALDGFALYASPSGVAEAGAAARVRVDALPAAARGFLREASCPSALWQAIPDDALFAVAGRTDFAAAVEMFARFMDAKGREDVRAFIQDHVAPALGRGVLEKVVAALGPDWGFWVAPPRETGAGWFPEFAFALRVGPVATPDGGGGGGEEARGEEVDRALLNGLNLLSFLLRFAYNRAHPGDDQIHTDEEKQGETVVRYFYNAKRFPRGFRPAFAIKGGYLLLTGSPETIRRFEPPAAGPCDVAAEVPLLRLSVREAREYLTRHRAALVALLADARGVPEPEVGRRFDELLANLSPFDRIEVVQQCGAGYANLTLRVRTEKPLRE